MGTRILVVDDEEAIGFALKRYFELQGLPVDVARDLEGARAHLGAGAYAVVLADLRLAGTNGEEGLALIEHVRERQPAACCVLLSAYLNHELEAIALRRGAQLVLRKPIALPELWRHVQDLLVAR